MYGDMLIDQLQRTLVMNVLCIHVLKIMQQNIAIQQALCIVFMLNFDQNSTKRNAEIELTKNRLIMCFTKQLTVFWDRGTPDLALFTPKSLFRFRKFAS